MIIFLNLSKRLFKLERNVFFRSLSILFERLSKSILRLIRSFWYDSDCVKSSIWIFLSCVSVCSSVWLSNLFSSKEIFSEYDSILDFSSSISFSNSILSDKNLLKCDCQFCNENEDSLISLFIWLISFESFSFSFFWSIIDCLFSDCFLTLF